MEIIRGYSTDVKFAVPGDLVAATFTVTYGTTTTSPSAAAIDSGIATCSLPYDSVLSDSVVVTLSFTYSAKTYTQSKTLGVVSPYIDIWDLRTILPTFTDVQIWDVERAVRRIIDTYCKQSFSPVTKTVNVLGNGYDYLKMPERLMVWQSMSVNGVSLFDINNIQSDGITYLGQYQYTLTGDGGYIRSNTLYCDRDGFIPPYGPSPIIINVNPIYNPFDFITPNFQNGIYYSILGTWGFAEVPAVINEAAKLLVNDYACKESLYRDRYLVTISAADWALEYSPGAYGGTGNVRADQLLAPYVKSNWLVI